MRQKFTAAVIAALLLIVTVPAFGQTLPKDKQAEVAFELRMDDLRDTPIYAMITQNMEQSGEVEFDPNDIKKIHGALALPEDLAGMQAMGDSNDLPVELYAFIEFTNSAAIDTILEEIKDKSETVEVGGNTYMKPAEGEDAPQNLMMRRVNDTTLEIGTEGYLSQGAGDALFSAGLAAAWAATPEDAIRIAVDFENSRDLMDEVVADGKENGPPMAAGFLDLITKAQNVRLTMDFRDGGNLLTLGTSGADDDVAEELRSGLDGILGLAKFGAGQMVQGLKEQDAEAAEVVSTILKSLNAKRDGSDIEIVIPKPDGFEDAVQSIMSMGMGGGF